MGHSTDWLLALAAGALLAVMIDLNSLLAAHSTPVFASWIAHGVGSIAALILIGLSSRFARGANDGSGLQRTPAPLWAYLGGVPGALTVVLAVITVNSSLALSGTLALMLVGQVAFGMISDRLGLLGVARRKFSPNDGFVVLSILSGSGILLFSGA